MITPPKSHCLIAYDELPTKIGSIFTPHNQVWTDLPSTGTVKYINPASKVEFRVGDRVVYDRRGQFMVTIRGEKLSRVKVGDVLAVFG